MFEHVPTDWWWVAAANLTSWFDWTALGAIATFAATLVALWVAVEASTRSQREKRAAEIAMLKAILLILDNGVEAMASHRRKLDTKGLDKKRLAEAVIAAWTPDEVFDALVSFKPSELPSTSGIALLLGARAAWSGMMSCWRVLSDKGSSGDLKGLDRMFHHAEQASKALSEEIRRLGGRAESHDDAIVKRRLEVRHGDETQTSAR